MIKATASIGSRLPAKRVLQGNAICWMTGPEIDLCGVCDLPRQLTAGRLTLQAVSSIYYLSEVCVLVNELCYTSTLSYAESVYSL